MELLLDNCLSTHVDWKDADKTCPTCREDETLSRKYHTKDYTSAANLERHLKYFHTPILEWKRWASNHCRNSNNGYDCPYCIEAGIHDATVDNTVEELVDHVQASNPTTSDSMHDKLKAEAGWYEEDFQASVTMTERPDIAKANMNRRKRNLQHAGIDLVPGRVPLERVPHETLPDIMIGPQPMQNHIPRQHPYLVKSGHPLPGEMSFPSERPTKRTTHRSHHYPQSERNSFRQASARVPQIGTLQSMYR